MSDRIRISMTDQTGGRLTLSGIPESAFETIEGVLNGQQWMMVEKGQPRFWPAREPLPDPIKDDEMLPYWQHDTQRQYTLRGVTFDEERRYDTPSFMVSHLCGYNYTPERYREQAELLASYGFVCMRSRRGADGRFWETWYLPGAWAAAGALEECVEGLKALPPIEDHAERSRRETDTVVTFLCRNASFGSLDVVVQRAAMALDD